MRVDIIKLTAALVAGGALLLGAAELSQTDRQFVMKALDGEMAEVEMGKLALERGSSDKVKEIGRTLSEEHAKSSERLKKLAAGKGLRVPMEPDAKQVRMGRLATLTDEDFDREFLRRQLRYHEEELQDFEQAAAKSDDPEVKGFAASMLPTLRKHLDVIRSAAQAVRVQ